MSGLTSLEVYNSSSLITEEKRKIKLYTELFNELPFTDQKDEL